MKKKQLFLRFNLSLIDLANEASIPVDEVKQTLRKRLHLTFFEFISEYKINEAKQLLTSISENKFSISTIATKSGFNTKDSFVIIFKQHTNISPEKYRIKYFRIDSDSNIPYKD